MKELTKLEVILYKVTSFLPNVYVWLKQSRCRHKFEYELKEKGWLNTGHLTFVVFCSKCDEDQTIYFDYPVELSKEKE